MISARSTATFSTSGRTAPTAIVGHASSAVTGRAVAFYACGLATWMSLAGTTGMTAGLALSIATIGAFAIGATCASIAVETASCAVAGTDPDAADTGSANASARPLAGAPPAISLAIGN